MPRWRRSSPGWPCPSQRRPTAGCSTIVAGTYREERLAPACDLNDGVILCADTLCDFHPMARRDLPPLKANCDLVRGTFRDFIVGQVSCELKDGTITVTCPIEPALEPWWAWRDDLVPVIVCEIRWIPSVQPMT